MTTSLMSSLDKAEWVRYDENGHLVLAWFGGTGVYTYDEGGVNVDFYTIGCKNDRPTLDEAQASIERALERMNRPDADD